MEIGAQAFPGAPEFQLDREEYDGTEYG